MREGLEARGHPHRDAARSCRASGTRTISPECDRRRRLSGEPAAIVPAPPPRRRSTGRRHHELMLTRGCRRRSPAFAARAPVRRRRAPPYGLGTLDDSTPPRRRSPPPRPKPRRTTGRWRSPSSTVRQQAGRVRAHGQHPARQHRHRHGQGDDRQQSAASDQGAAGRSSARAAPTLRLLAAPGVHAARGRRADHRRRQDHRRHRRLRRDERARMPSRQCGAAARSPNSRRDHPSRCLVGRRRAAIVRPGQFGAAFGKVGAAMKQRIFGWIISPHRHCAGPRRGRGHGDRLAVSSRTAATRRRPSSSSARRTPTCATRPRARPAATSTRSIRIPIVAFVHHANPPCGMPWVNNVGLFGPDFPTVKPTDRYVVMLTGGSVASQLGAEPEAAGAALPRGGAEQEVRQPQRQALDGAERRRRRLEGAAALHPVLALRQLGRRHGHAGRLQRALSCSSPACGPSGSSGRLSNFIEVNPFVADENFGDAAIGWVMGRIAGTPGAQSGPGPIACRLHDHPRHRGGGQEQDGFKSNKRTTTLAYVRAAPGHLAAIHERALRPPARPLSEVRSGDRGGGAATTV